MRRLSTHTGIVAMYSGHVDLYGYGTFDWSEHLAPSEHASVELLRPVVFLSQYHSLTGSFGMSWMCVLSDAVRSLGGEPFKISGAEDAYFATSLALLGPVGRSLDPLCVYRVTPESQSVDRIKVYGLCVGVFELLEGDYAESASKALRRAFARAFASRRRLYAKHLMAVGRRPEARHQLRMSLANSLEPASIVKSTALLSSTYLPEHLQPAWPEASRGWTELAG
jgi:hypothetical protein